MTSANVEMWLELANSLMIVGVIVFAAGAALGALVTILIIRRRSRRQKAWLKARQAAASSPAGMADLLQFHAREVVQRRGR